ncbi:MAG: hypothetical protein Q4E67_02200 [Planctomycetia bacterium]|nr:hypothetical protein [Planctomycetia bacterium]
MYFPLWESTILVVAAILILGWLARWSLSGHWDWVVLRWLVLGLLGWIWLRPVFLTTETQILPGTVLILADTSRSMGVRDESSGEESRWERLRRAFGESSDALGRLSASVEVQVWGFSEKGVPVDEAEGKIAFPATPEGNQTAIGSAIQEMFLHYSDRRILGMVLASDGAQRSLPPRDLLPQTALARLRRQQIPLYTLTLGKSWVENPREDLAVVDFVAEQRIYLGNPLAMTAAVRVEGFAGKAIPVELWAERNGGGNAEKVAQTAVKTERKREILPVTMAWTPEVAGEYKLWLRIPVQAGETSETNNELAAFVNVTEGGMPVLYLEGTFRPEMSFLRRALDASPEIRMETLRCSGAASSRGVLGERLRQDYAVLLLGDVPAETFTTEEWETLREKVAGGMGLLTMGGLQAYEPGGYAGTALAEVLPMTMEPPEKQRFQKKISEYFQWDQPLMMIPTAAGRQSGLLEMDSDSHRTEEIWKSLPVLEGANRWRGWKPGATLLAEAPRKGREGIPLLLQQTYGEGRVLSLAADSTWRWWLGGFEDAHKRFWRQMILWLAKKETAVDGEIFIHLPQRRFSQEQEVHFQVGAKLSDGETLVNREGTRWNVTLEAPDGSRTEIPLTAGSETMLGTAGKLPAPGDYTLTASVWYQEEKVGETQSRFLVWHEDLEMDNVQAEPQWMESLAVSSGGRAVLPAELDDLWQELLEKRQDLRVEQNVVTPVWDRWYWLATLLFLLCLEWFLRRRSGWA